MNKDHKDFKYPDSVALQAKLTEGDYTGKTIEDLLKDYALGEKKGFTPYTYTSEHSIITYFKPDADYSEVLTDEITLYKSIETHEIVGCKINRK